MRNLVLVLGDQLNLDASAFDGFDPTQDAVWMAEVAEESTHVWSAKQRIVVFLSAMRHFAQALRAANRPLHYMRLDDAANTGTLATELARCIAQHQPQGLVLTAPGDWRVYQSLRAVAASHNLPLQVRDDRTFFSTVNEFADHAKGRKQLRMEYFYREMRRKHAVLMEGDQPAGGQWNFDADNREAFGKTGPQNIPPRYAVTPDETTAQVIDLVNTRFANHPGSLGSFGWPVTRAAALTSLASFITERLPQFGQWEDAMWPDQPWLWHSHLSVALNLKLLSAHEVVATAQTAWQQGEVPLASAEGFIRQILGWREFVRGIYWTQMPGYVERNALAAEHPLPALYWTGQTDMACMAQALKQTLEHGYSHHIQRLMVTGLYALLFGVAPRSVHEWYLAVYVDAVEWVELPNTLGMGQAADGGLMASKPYIASGKYIERMSSGSFCAQCRYKPGERVGDKACPFTTLYWDFLIRHETLLAANPRTVMQVRNVARLQESERQAIRERAERIRSENLSDASVISPLLQT